jgi:NAD(P)-dependent dehydrogenase (short-subunit alcohol dehydrogenase family)
MNQLLQDKVIVVSGGTKGVGKGVILESAKQGANVVIGGRDEKSANEVLKQVCEMGKQGIFVYTDLRDIKDCEKLFDGAYNRFGKVDGFFSYAGVTHAASLEDLDDDNYSIIFAVNVRAALFCCKSAVKYMKMNPNGGSIVLNGSPHAWGGEQDRVAYACSKGALLTLTEHIAQHYAEFGIRSNYITMGWTPTEGELELRRTQNMSVEELHKLAASMIPAGRMTEISDLVPGVIYLLSDYSKMVAGSNLRITGGWYI